MGNFDSSSSTNHRPVRRLFSFFFAAVQLFNRSWPSPPESNNLVLYLQLEFTYAEWNEASKETHENWRSSKNEKISQFRVECGVRWIERRKRREEIENYFPRTRMSGRIENARHLPFATNYEGRKFQIQTLHDINFHVSYLMEFSNVCFLYRNFYWDKTGGCCPTMSRDQEWNYKLKHNRSIEERESSWVDKRGIQNRSEHTVEARSSEQGTLTTSTTDPNKVKEEQSIIAYWFFIVLFSCSLWELLDFTGLFQ